MKLYSLKQLSESKEQQIAEDAKKALKSGRFPDTARFEISIYQVIV